MKNFVAQKRLQKNITQQELAYKIEISVSGLANIENNRNIPSVEIALKIAEYLKCTVEEIFQLTKKE